MIPSAKGRMWGGRIAVSACLVALVGLWACGDQNLFAPESGEFGAPRLEIQEPSSGEGFPAEDSVLVDVEVTDPDLRPASGVQSVLFEGVRFVGDRDLGTFAEVQRFQPKEVTFDDPVTGTQRVTRFLVPVADTTAGIVFLRVTAEDASGNVTKDSVAIEVGAPRVQILTPQDGDEVGQGSQMTIRVQASDPTGIASMEITADGSVTLPGFPVSRTFDPVEDTATVEETVTVPNETGTLELSASAVNSEGVEGNIGPVTVDIIAQQVGDETPPELRIRMVPRGATDDPRRMELTDVMEFLVEGRDNSGGTGVGQAGVTLQATPKRDPNTTTVVPISAQSFDPPRTGTFTATFEVGMDELEAAGVLDLLQAPDTMNLEFHGFMVDDAGNCAAAVNPDDFQSLECGTLPSGETVAADAAGQTDFVVGVTGQTVQLPEGGRIADAAIDEPRQQLVLSNIERGRLEVFDLVNRTFDTEILVGSEPWGLFFDRTDPDELFVANSGGTNISVVDMTTESEDLSQRILTPNTVLWEVTETEGDDGGRVFSPPEFFDFSDRPQFLAQDQNGHLVYSTEPTDAATDGTIRLGLVGLGPDTEVILYTGHTAFLEGEDIHAFGNVDDVDVVNDADSPDGGANATLDDAIVVTDHTVGDRSATTTTPATDPANSDEALTAPQTIEEMFNISGAFNDGTANGSWDLGEVGLSDTTFVASSGDGSMVAIGEGATTPNGRIIVYEAPTAPATPRDHVGTVSSVVDVVDLVGNAAERVLGVALNEDATFGVARGLEAVYFFTPDDLRLQGLVSIEGDEGGAGVALHPLHSGDPVSTNPNVSLAFAPTGDRTVEVYDTRHFTRIGRVFVRQTVVGQIRAVLPFAGDNAGLTCPTVAVGSGNAVEIFSDPDGQVINTSVDRECTVVKLAAVTDDGGVVVVDATVEDIVRDHPDN